jgi:hypothetical protein
VVAALFLPSKARYSWGGAPAIGAALTMIGIPRNLIVKYEIALKAEKYVLILHGDASDVEGALGLGYLAHRASNGVFGGASAASG